ncbi:hypothetical protein PC129_g10784 [Phytophthora cactorum]|uniref:Uncharacterized protein n=1 Tax=Phytophthora cactorum TaxID=29920 RepID=A0A329S8C8_9STRA|nr:hypothetical protein Pcac1_g7244 [Phytophthora cactorum]KAG2907784.1 hypothetical protein PC114_g10722 [Phytophthora cactorum]KAG2936882.1 hypothetical protein PC117_g11930 [Phytophthora cactorum]KAG3015376.1 hypothetical protein PC119_g11800 [Phytophthora cactorum]KAG3174985.1 hypothetical protein C6341_g9655 [Phytophthora cactorum]
MTSPYKSPSDEGDKSPAEGFPSSHSATQLDLPPPHSHDELVDVEGQDGSPKDPGGDGESDEASFNFATGSPQPDEDGPPSADVSTGAEAAEGTFAPQLLVLLKEVVLPLTPITQSKVMTTALCLVLRRRPGDHRHHLRLVGDRCHRLVWPVDVLRHCPRKPVLVV